MIEPYGMGWDRIIFNRIILNMRESYGIEDNHMIWSIIILDWDRIIWNGVELYTVRWDKNDMELIESYMIQYLTEVSTPLTFL